MLSLGVWLSLVFLMGGGFLPGVCSCFSPPILLLECTNRRLFLEAVAEECFPTTATGEFETEAEYNSLAQLNCDTLVGGAYFHSKFTKNLVVPKITNISKTLALRGNDVVESIEFPDLEYAHLLHAYGFPRLKRISMPKLRHVHSIFLELESQEVTVDFPSLESVNGQLSMIGNWTR